MFVGLSKFIIALVVALMFVSCQSQATIASMPKILLPLYIYPNWYEPESYVWSDVASAAAQVPITAIVNPNNGPDGKPPNEDYQRGLADLRETNITLIGYVYTLYGDRPIKEVKQDINLYDRYYNLDGIFLDESASSGKQLAYYQKLYKYIKTKNNAYQVVINPGTHTDEVYSATPAADTTVIFEHFPQDWEKYQPQDYVHNYPKERFASLIHSVADAADMKKYIDLAISYNMGYIYVTDDSPNSDDGDPWNSLPSYWQEEVDYIHFLKLRAKS